MQQHWASVSASVTGSGHTKTGLPCQDANRCAIVGQYLIGAVADGAGSVSRADKGSAIAVATAVEHLTAAADSCGEADAGAFPPLVRESMAAARSCLQAEAEREAVDIREYSTTLIVFVASPVWIVANQIGDGALVALTDQNELLPVTKPPQSEFINETTFLTSEVWQSHMQEAELRRNMRAIAAFSDGLQQLALKFPDATPFAPFFSPLFSLLSGRDLEDAQRQLEAFLDSKRLNDRTDDDKTLLLARLLPS